MKLVSITQLSAIGKGAIGLVLTLGALFQIPIVGDVVTAQAHLHPHIATVVATITLLTTLLTNPQVQRVLGVNLAPGDTLKVQNPALTPEGGLTADSATLQKAKENSNA